MPGLKRSLSAMLQRSVLNEPLAVLVHHMRQRRKFPETSFGYRCVVTESCVFGSGVSFGKRCVAFDSKLGRHSYCADEVFLSQATIGPFSSIGPRTIIGMGAHPSRDFVSSSPVFYNPSYDPTGRLSKGSFVDHAEVIVGADVWIGANVFIGPGRKIGTGAIIGTGAVVTKDVQPYEVIGGVPAKRLRMRFTEDQVAFLLKSKWWELSDAELEPFAGSFESVEKFRESWERSGR